MSLPAMDMKAHQNLLRRIRQDLSMQTEEVVEDSDPMVNTFTPEDPSKVALPHKNCTKHHKGALTDPSLYTTYSRGVEKHYFIPQKGHEDLFTHPQPGTLVVDAANRSPPLKIRTPKSPPLKIRQA